VLADNVLLKSDYGSIAIYLKGIMPEYDKKVTEIHNSIIAGDKNFSKHSNGIYLGIHLAKSLNVKTGDIIRVIPAQITFSALGIVPGIKKLQVSGIYKTGLYEYDSSMGYCSLNTAEKIFRKNDKITHYEISVFDIDNADATANIISQKYNLKYYAYSWMAMNKNLFTALKLEKTVMFIILTLIIGVAALNIASSIIVLVVEKTKEIGILRALGLSKNSIMRIFMFKGFFIGIMGSVSGTVLGLLINFCISKYKIKIPGDVYFIENLPVKISGVDIIIISVTAVIICILASLYPAYKSSKLDPVEAIRNE
jgi:lipoprotein-releasing system permease protein